MFEDDCMSVDNKPVSNNPFAVGNRYTLSVGRLTSDSTAGQSYLGDISDLTEHSILEASGSRQPKGVATTHPSLPLRRPFSFVFKTVPRHRFSA